MKKSICVLVLVIFLAVTTLTACGNSMVIDGKEYETYGVISKDEVKDPAIKYRLIVGNLVWGCILIETVLAPVYFFGWSLWEPVGKKN